MHFTKAILSLAVLGFTTAQLEDNNPGLAARQAAQEAFLEARDVYLAARDDYLLEKRKNPPPARMGNCIKSPNQGIMTCAIRGVGVCGYCSANAKIGSTCRCNP
ncbi:unnamed protein product [Clonostachys rosea]|uniref:Invertebrate defensins family profile domain-containing protein n=1 Tax=Bionectria ochroleuca TaxID=29856 RepID=A0ABY6U6H4_BIOOC|nr:unnamed protein product [Clonostachys rosea]